MQDDLEKIEDIAKQLNTITELYTYGINRFLYPDDVKLQLQKASFLINQLGDEIKAVPDLSRGTAIIAQAKIKHQSKIEKLKRRCSDLLFKIDKPFKLYFKEHDVDHLKKSFPHVTPFPDIRRIMHRFSKQEGLLLQRRDEENKIIWVLPFTDSIRIEAIEHLQRETCFLDRIEIKCVGTFYAGEIVRYPMAWYGSVDDVWRYYYRTELSGYTPAPEGYSAQIPMKYHLW